MLADAPLAFNAAGLLLALVILIMTDHERRKARKNLDRHRQVYPPLPACLDDAKPLHRQFTTHHGDFSSLISSAEELGWTKCEVYFDAPRHQLMVTACDGWKTVSIPVTPHSNRITLNELCRALKEEWRKGALKGVNHD